MLSEFLLVLLLISVIYLIKELKDTREEFDEKIGELDAKIHNFFAELSNLDDEIAQVRAYLEINNDA